MTSAVVRRHELCGVQHVADLLGRRGGEPKVVSCGRGDLEVAAAELEAPDVLLDNETSGLKARQDRLLQRCVGVAAEVDGEGVRVTREVEASSGGSDIDTKSQFLRGGVDEADVAAGVVSRELRLGVGLAAEPVRQAGYGQGHQRLVGA